MYFQHHSLDNMNRYDYVLKLIKYKNIIYINRDIVPVD